MHADRQTVRVYPFSKTGTMTTALLFSSLEHSLLRTGSNMNLMPACLPVHSGSALRSLLSLDLQINHRKSKVGLLTFEYLRILHYAREREREVFCPPSSVCIIHYMYVRNRRLCLLFLKCNDDDDDFFFKSLAQDEVVAAAPAPDIRYLLRPTSGQRN